MSSTGRVNAAMLSHGTLESTDLHATRRFYEEVLGLTVHQYVPVSIHIDTGDGYMYAAVHAPNATKAMPIHYRNTLLFGTREEIDRAHLALETVATEYGVQEITELASSGDRYFFRLRDLDGNWWELAYDVHGGYHGIGDVGADR
ncbi:VOC family protein [Kribbella kalugense]|uniref:Glyoxalase/bleomycin resistance protein/dioxygenase superfamily protein n=1 Tax=Kribbella kalugense TaxID=2512221 RepID=A0A4R8A798_9ACTN|nr:VOC family protein [Kribbella kalugense]TDW24200.1 glyoxalase/bleomycin resistance protein/dioxygenase superfamily protein [Kribbella kalugense]